MRDKKTHHFRVDINNKKLINLRNLILTFIIVFMGIGFSLYGIFKSYEAIMISNTQKEMSNKLLIAKGFLALLDEQISNEKLTEEEAQKLAKDYMSGPIMENGYRDLSKSKLGFNNSAYVYAFSTSGLAIMHPFIEGQELWNYRDEYDRYIIREIVDEGRFGKIIEYSWKNPGGNVFKALDYSEYFEPWGWIIGLVEDEQVIYLDQLNGLKIGMILFLFFIAPLITIIIQLLFVANTKKEKLKKQFYYSSYFDSLTGLPNRIFFNDRLRQRINRLESKSQLLGIIVLDIDKFKKINDTMGHRVGDELLKEIAKRLKNCINSKHLLARHSDDEFILLMPNINKIENSTDMAEEILEVLTKPFIVENYELYITASMGISIYPYNGQTAEVLVKNADTAMNFVKGEGRNNYLLYAPSMDDTAIEQIELENDLRKALTKDELVLHYQPLVEIEGGNIIGMEALLRWNRPGVGFVQPAKFIPAAEETGMIISIGEWVLNKACRQNKEWQLAGYSKIRVSVNISSRQFDQGNFVDTVKGALRAAGLDASYLELEITEDVIKNVVKASETMKSLKEIGVKISLDDFGTGYSSLSYLKKLPIDTLKIDKSFVSDVTMSEKEVALTTAVINMGHNLKLQVLAEGVETKEQLELLKENKCDVVQGFYYSRPVNAEAFEKLLKDGFLNVKKV
ncbi:MAG: hypothetical protein K0R09_934 [Clostridiales bacterium]|jgi:diguanylate cyclase (GGDEF)-like protein|nr:hypothetical protein [Clostridiales bacterium]